MRTKIVLDTNVLVSALFGGKPFDVVALIAEDEIDIVYSLEIYEEYYRILLSEKFKFSKEYRKKILRLVREYGIHIDVTSVSHQSRDEHDNKFIECAIDGEADYIVSGDIHLLELHKSHDIPILSPADFLAELKK